MASPDDLLLRCHFVYEVKMIWETYARFLRRDFVTKETVIRNALIESFCVHARNLIEFLRGKHRRKYTRPSYRPFCDVPTEKINAINDRLNDQISHLRFGRTVKTSEKI